MPHIGHEINFDGSFGEETKRVSITQYWDMIYYVTVDLRHWGEVAKVNGQWVGDINPFGEMYYEDISIIGDIIDDSLSHTKD